MDPRKLKVLGEIIDHLTSRQGGNLKSLLDESKMPVVEEIDVEKMPEDDSMIGDPQEDKISDMGSEVPEIEATPEGEVEEIAQDGMVAENPGEELTDEELEALLAKLG